MTATRMFATGALEDLAPEARRALMDRAASRSPDVRSRTAAIIDDVRERGDGALRDMAREFDHVALETIDVPRSTWGDALDRLDASVRRALERAARNIADTHRAFLPVATEFVTADGVTIGRRPDPLGRVGVYAPGGRAAYPSSLLMGAVPAKIARVGEVIVCSPPGAAGVPSDVVLAAAEVAGVDAVFACGGAGAVAAMAYGTVSVRRVDRIVGPGNAYVAEAKLQVAGLVGIDAPAGPSELLVIADGTQDAGAVALEVIAQAEHDPLAAVIVVSTDARWADDVGARIVACAHTAARAEVIGEALRARGAVLVARDIDAAVEFASAFAAEHVMLATARPREILPRIRNAGTVFLGVESSVTFGDYLTGANHVLPTGGMARAYSGLSTLDFVRWTTYQCVDRAAATRLANDVAALADAEGLPGHTAAARQWSTT